ncbi:hypothetical protein BIY24_01745 [Halobacteriovorax marinus]|nr:hypothetical protein BIY24_01745 [Halobacteriovorax marinus]
MEGGGLYTKNPSNSTYLESCNNFGFMKDGTVSHPGLNAKLSELHSAFGYHVLKEVPLELERRERIRQIYHEKIKSTEGLRIASYDKNITKSSLQYFTIYIEDTYRYTRDELIERFNNQRIFPRMYFYPLTTEANFISENNHQKKYPISYKASRRVLAIPFHGKLDDKTLSRIINTL